MFHSLFCLLIETPAPSAMVASAPVYLLIKHYFYEIPQRLGLYMISALPSLTLRILIRAASARAVSAADIPKREPLVSAHIIADPPAHQLQLQLIRILVIYHTVLIFHTVALFLHIMKKPFRNIGIHTSQILDIPSLCSLVII